ncbi:MAG: hypothetical protein ABSF67_11265 [Roseiarcus sp.]
MTRTATVTDRRAFLAGAFALAVSPGVGHASAARQVIYLGASNCPYCADFEANYETALIQRVESRGATFREVRVASFYDVRQANAWPADLTWLRDSLRDEDVGTPWFFTIEGKRIISQTHAYK